MKQTHRKLTLRPTSLRPMTEIDLVAVQGGTYLRISQVDGEAGDYTRFTVIRLTTGCP
jgi:hypothetical protein